MIQVHFPSKNHKLQGFLFPPGKTPPLATVIFLQGFPGIEGDELICERLAQHGVTVLTFNYRGTFKSEGSFTFSNAIADIGAALQYIQGPEFRQIQPVDPGKIVLGGWSFGSGLLPVGAVRNPAIQHILMIAGRDFGEEAHRIQQDHDYAQQVRQNLQGIRTPDGPVHLDEDMLDDLVAIRDAFDLENLVPSLAGRDILMIGAWDDEINAIENHLLPLYRSLVAHGAKKVRIEAFQDGHEFSSSKDRMVELIVDWLGKIQARG